MKNLSILVCFEALQSTAGLAMAQWCQDIFEVTLQIVHTVKSLVIIMSRLEAHFTIYRLFIRRKFNVYLL